MKLETVNKLELLDVNVEVAPFKRAFAAGILLMNYTSLRFSDVRRIRSLEVTDDSIRGTLLQSKTKRHHGLSWPWACPRVGVAGSTAWINPILDFHVAHEKQNGTKPSFVFPRLNRKWELERAEGAAYSITRRKLALICSGLEDTDAELYKLHSPKNFLPTAATQMNFAPRELIVIGHWSSGSRMNERYDRSVCANELLLRNTIIQKVISGWTMVDSFCLPETVAGDDRIGKFPVASTPEVAPTPSGSLPSTQTQESSRIEDTPLQDVFLADTSHVALPVETGAVRV